MTGLLYKFQIKDLYFKDHDIEAVGLDKISSSYPGIKVTNIRAKVDGVPTCNSVTDEKLERTGGALDLLIGSDLSSLHPKGVKDLDNLTLMRSRFATGWTLMGHNNDLVQYTGKQQGVKVNACAVEAIHFRKQISQDKMKKKKYKQKIMTEGKSIIKPFEDWTQEDYYKYYDFEEDSYIQNLVTECVMTSQVEAKPAPSKESFSTISAEIQAGKDKIDSEVTNEVKNDKDPNLKVVKMEKESFKTDSAVSVKNPKKPREICSFIKLGSMKINLEENELNEDKEIEIDDTDFKEEEVETFAEVPVVREGNIESSNVPTTPPKEFIDDTFASTDDHFQAHEVTKSNHGMIKTKPPDHKSFNSSQRKSNDLVKDDQNFVLIKTSRYVSNSKNPLHEEGVFRKVADEEDVPPQVDDKENDDKHPVEVEPDPKPNETRQELPRTSTGRKRMDL